MTNLNDHIKQQQEVNRERYPSDGFYGVVLISHEDLDTLTATTIKKTLEFVKNSLMPWVEHDSQCILQRNERGEPTEDGGYRTMYAGVWYKSGEEPPCDCGLEKALTQLEDSKKCG